MKPLGIPEQDFDLVDDTPAVDAEIIVAVVLAVTVALLAFLGWLGFSRYVRCVLCE